MVVVVGGGGGGGPERGRVKAHRPFSAAFLAERGLPSNLRRVRPRVFLNQLYICCEECQGVRLRREEFRYMPHGSVSRTHR